MKKVSSEMDKDKKALKKQKPKENASSTKRPISKGQSGDATAAEISLMEKAKAFKEINKIFAEVAEEYPEFLEETDGDDLRHGGDGSLMSALIHHKLEKNLNAESEAKALGLEMETQSGPIVQGDTKTAHKFVPKKGVSLAGVSAPPPPTLTRKQLKASTLTKESKKKGFVPPPPPGPPPKQAFRPPVKSKMVKLAPEPSLVEIFSNKPEFGVPTPSTSETFPMSTSTATATASSFQPETPIQYANTTQGILAQIVQSAQAEAEFEASGPFCDTTLIRNHGTSSTNYTSSSSGYKSLPQPLMGPESRIALACQITAASVPPPKPMPSNLRDEPVSTSFVPLHGRVGTVPEIVEHDDFASEFIKSLEVKAEKYEKKMKDELEESYTFEYLPKKSETLAPLAPLPLDAMNSLKLVHKYPIWPHQVPLNRTLSHLPALKSVILDDSEIKWLRDLGSSLPNLITLSVMRCQLTSLDGTFAFPNLQNLFAADNKIRSPAPLSCLEHLRFVDLSGNNINSFEGFQFLRICTSLRCLKLIDTAVGSFTDFHTEMRRLIPSLRELQPKNSDLHGIDIFAEKEELEVKHSLPKLLTNPPENWYEYKVKRNVHRLRTESADSGDYAEPTAYEKRVTWEVNNAQTEDERNANQVTGEDMDSPAEQIEWREEEKRLREVYIPGRVQFKKRGPAMMPTGIDEMDALLDQLEGTNGLEEIKAEYAKNDPTKGGPPGPHPLTRYADISDSTEVPSSVLSDSTTY